MITDEQHPEMLKALQEVLRRLGLSLGRGNRRLDKYLIDEMFGIVKQHREECRLRGIDFPVLVAIVVPRLGIVDWKRADLDVVSIGQCIVNFVRGNPAATMEEVVLAFRGAYPDLRPDDILQGVATGANANERAAERRKSIIREAAPDLVIDDDDIAKLD